MEKQLDVTGVSRRDSLTESILTAGFKNINDFCKQKGFDYAAIYRYIHNNIRISDKVARRLESALGKSDGFLDQKIPRILTVTLPVISTRLSNASFIYSNNWNKSLVKYLKKSIPDVKIRKIYRNSRFEGNRVGVAEIFAYRILPDAENRNFKLENKIWQEMDDESNLLFEQKIINDELFNSEALPMIPF